MKFSHRLLTNITCLVVAISCSTYAMGQIDAQKAFSDGVTFLQNEDFAPAIQQFELAIQTGEVKEGIKMAWVYKGFAFNGLTDYERAVDCFSQAIALDSSDAATFIDRGIAHTFTDSIHLAVQDFEHALLLDSVGRLAKAAYFYLGKLHLLAYENETAVIYLDQLLQLAPTDAEGYFLRAIAQQRLANDLAALADYDKAIYYKPDYTEAYANRGVLKLNRVPIEEKNTKSRKMCLTEPCPDLIRAFQLGDEKVKDLVHIYCNKCKQ